MFKRISLFLITNLAIILVLSFTARLLGVDRFLTANGLNLGALLVFAAIFGFGGSFISLAISKWMAKRATGAQVIEQPSQPDRALAGGYGAPARTARRYRHARGGDLRRRLRSTPLPPA